MDGTSPDHRHIATAFSTKLQRRNPNSDRYAPDGFLTLSTFPHFDARLTRDVANGQS
jgi:hypothetical protein